jgi:hypothetical protein
MRVLAFLLGCDWLLACLAGAVTASVACGVALFLWLRNTKPMGY